MDSAVLPRYVVLQSKSNSKYVSCGKEDGVLRCNGEDVTSPNCKFSIHAVAGRGKECFYMKSAYNNKYVGRADGGGYSYYVADLTSAYEHFWSNQIGEPFIQISTPWHELTVCFDHPPPKDLCLVLRPGGSDESLFKVIDWESLVVLPKHIAFKGFNGYYVGPRLSITTSMGQSKSVVLPKDNASEGSDWGFHYYVGCTYDDIGDPEVANEIIRRGDGSVTIQSKCMGTEAFWGSISKNSHVWTCPKALYEDKDAFVPVKVGDNTVALLSLANNKFCRYWTETGCIHPDRDSITTETIFTVEEVILSSSIYDVKFRINDARIYDEEITSLATAELENYSPTQTDTLVLKEKYTKTTARTWDASFSLKLGYSASIKAGIPEIGEAGITVSVEVEGSYTWGGTHAESEESETDFKVDVPPMHKATASLVATTGKCDIPFSYTRKDHLRDGTTSPCYHMDDGIFIGINSYHFHYTHTEDKLLPKPQ